MRAEIPTREIEEARAEESDLQAIELGGFVLLVGSDTAAAINRAPSLGHLDVDRVAAILIAVEVVIVERLLTVIALDQPAAGRIEMRDGQSQAGIVRKRKHGLHQTLSERGLAQNQGAVVVL